MATYAGLGRCLQAGTIADELQGKSIKSEPNSRNDAVVDGLFGSNLNLVVAIAKEYEGVANNRLVDLGFTLDELIQQGNFGLRLAAERFDSKTDVGFSTYATWWIRQAIFRALIQVRAVRNDRSAPGPQARLEQLGAVSEFREDINRLLELLDERERALLGLRLGLDRGSAPRTLAEVSERFRLTRERVRQIEARSLSKILHFELTDLSIAADRLTHD